MRLFAEFFIYATVLALAIPTGKAVANWHKSYLTSPTKGDYAQYFVNQPHQLSLHGTSDCPACRLAREFLNKEGVAFNDLRVDESKSSREEWKKLGQDSYPVFLTPSNLRVGFEENRMRSLIQHIRSASSNNERALSLSKEKT